MMQIIKEFIIIIEQINNNVNNPVKNYAIANMERSFTEVRFISIYKNHGRDLILKREKKNHIDIYTFGTNFKNWNILLS